MSKILKYIAQWYLLPSRSRGRSVNPRNVNFPITDNCNSRCIMCNVWKEPSANEMSPEEIFNVLSDRGFQQVEHLGISGGEPTLRKDLVECIDSILRAISGLQTLSITSHGYHYHRWERFLPRIVELCDQNGVCLTLNLSIDGYGATHDAVRGIKGAFGRVSNTLSIAKSLGVKIQVQYTISTENVFGVPVLFEHAKQMGVEVIFRLAVPIARLGNEELIPGRSLSSHEASFLRDFYLHSDLDKHTLSPARRLYYREMSKWLLRGGNRPMPCYYQNEGVFLEPHGDVYFCSVQEEKIGSVRDQGLAQLWEMPATEAARAKLKQDTCVGCMHDQSGAWHPLRLVIERLSQTALPRFGLVAWKLLKCAQFSAVWLQSSLRRSRETGISLDDGGLGSEPKMLLIGAYGGEHVGDAAILGGVVLRAIRKYGCRSFDVISFRRDRTQRWVDSIKIHGVTIRVLTGSDVNSSNISQYQRVIYAGGPLMEMPFRLLEHMRVVSYASMKSIPFSLEGVGIGPLNTEVSRKIVNGLLRQADEVVVRTSAAGAYCDRLPINYELDRDPAFDYLDYLAAAEQMPVEHYERRVIQNFSSETGTPVVAINLRPFWKVYSKSDVSSDQLERDVILRIAESLQQIHASLSGRVRFVYFAMNADQYGYSDFIMGYKLLEAMGEIGIELAILECEFGISGLVHVMKSFDAVISMRFHGCIFAMSAKPGSVIGIDYQVGAKGKVSELFEECGHAELAVNIASFSPDELSHRVLKILPVAAERVNENTVYT